MFLNEDSIIDCEFQCLKILKTLPFGEGVDILVAALGRLIDIIFIHRTKLS